MFSPDGIHVVTAFDYSAQIWNIITGEFEAELQGDTGQVESAVFTPDGLHVVSAHSGHTTRIWNTATGECEAELKPPYISENTQISDNGVFI